nr:hypothetical protein [uncultured Mediterranean phage uvMED]
MAKLQTNSSTQSIVIELKELNSIIAKMANDLGADNILPKFIMLQDCVYYSTEGELHIKYMVNYDVIRQHDVSNGAYDSRDEVDSDY